MGTQKVLNSARRMFVSLTMPCKDRWWCQILARLVVGGIIVILLRVHIIAVAAASDDSWQPSQRFASRHYDELSKNCSGCLMELFMK